MHSAFFAALPTRDVAPSEYLYAKPEAQRTEAETDLLTSCEYKTEWQAGIRVSVVRKIDMVASVAALKALNTSYVTSACLMESGREGMFAWSTGNYLTRIAADVAEGVYIKADAVAASLGAWVRVDLRMGYLVDWFGADRTGVLDSAAAFQAAIDLAESMTQRPAVLMCAGQYRINSTVTISALYTRLVGEGMFNTVVKPGMTDGSPVFDIAGGFDNWHASGFWINGTVNDANYIAGTADPQNCIGIRAVQDAGGTPARFSMRDIRVRGCAQGMEINSFIFDITGVLIDYCTLGFKGTTLNNALLGLRFENCRKDFAVSDSNGLTFTSLLAEGAVANSLSSTMDDCRGVVMTSPYWESGSAHPRTEPFLTVGGATECTNVEILGASVAGSSGMAASIYPIKIDRCNGGQITGEIAEGTQRATVETTTNTKNFGVMVTTLSGGFMQDASGLASPAFNYFPNPALETWFRGWKDVVTADATLSQETTVVRRGPNALRVTATAGQDFNSVTFRLPNEVYAALRGKTIRMGAWIWVPADAAFLVASRTAFAGLLIASNNGSVSVSSATKNSFFLAGAWNFFWSETLAVQADSTQIACNVYVNQSANLAAGTEYVVVDSIVVTESSVPLERMMRGEMMDSVLLPSFSHGRLVAFGDAAPTDTDQAYGLGDQVWRRSPAAATSMGWVCTAAGSPGTWTAMPNLAA